MMERDHVMATLRAHAGELQALGIAHLFLFESVARNAATPSSDVDLFFDFEDPGFSAIELLRAKRRVEEILHNPADVMTRGSLHPRLRPTIEQTALQVF
jgi:predicted nucleotidyltransferase